MAVIVGSKKVSMNRASGATTYNISNLILGSCRTFGYLSMENILMQKIGVNGCPIGQNIFKRDTTIERQRKPVEIMEALLFDLVAMVLDDGRYS